MIDAGTPHEHAQGRPEEELHELQRLRRRLHQVPEVGLDLPRTRDLLLSELNDLPLEIHRGTSCTSIVAILRGALPGPTVLLRSDMDALPLVETTGLPYAAEGDAMHACGHDLHMAALVGAARLLAAEQAAMRGNVLLMFQPGEEGHGGARAMIDDGLLDLPGAGIDAAYALHVIADLPHGVVHSRPGPVMAAYGVLGVEVHGRGAHGGRPQEGADPVPVAAEIVTALHTYVDRRFDKFDPVVLTVGELHAGTAPNVVPATATLRAGIRTFSQDATARVAVELPRLVEGISRAHGIDATVTLTPVMPPTVNHRVHARIVEEVSTHLFGADKYVDLAQPRTGSEDFSEVLLRVPGAFCYFGAAQSDAFEADAWPVGNHSPQSRFDDSILSDAARLLAGLARHHLIPSRTTTERPA